MHKLNICNSGFALICIPDFEHTLMVYACLLFTLEHVLSNQSSEVLMDSSVNQETGSFISFDKNLELQSGKKKRKRKNRNHEKITML